MDEIKKRTELMMNVMDATTIPHFSMEKLRDERCRKISLGQLTAFGLAFEPLVAAIQAITGNAEHEQVGDGQAVLTLLSVNLLCCLLQQHYVK